MSSEYEYIHIRGAKENNLRNVDVDIPKNKLVVITGVSGSGKSSIAFHTIYAEGQRRYVESLSAYARQFLEMQERPDVESISGLSPAIAIDQKTTSKNNMRSTVSTATELHDYMRLLFARIGIPYSPVTNQPIEKQTISQMVDKVLELPLATKVHILAPIVRGQKGEHRKELMSATKSGFERVRIDGLIYDATELPVIDKNKRHNIEIVVDRLIVGENVGNRLADSIETAVRMGEGVMCVEIVSLPEDFVKTDDLHDGAVLMLSEKFACPVSGFSLAEIEPRIFSFNSPYGACQGCNGLGVEYRFDENLLIANTKASLLQGALAPWSERSSQYGPAEEKFFSQTVESLAKHYNFDYNEPFYMLSETIRDAILYGSGKDEVTFYYSDGVRKSSIKQPFEGFIPYLERKLAKAESNAVKEELSAYQSVDKCRVCDGYRLRQESLCVKIGGKHIGEICAMTVKQAMSWFEDLIPALSEKHRQIGERPLNEVLRRLNFLKDVGLGYLALSRSSGTLSGGESQRIRLASQIGSGLSGVIYVLDEPSIGLHQCDNAKLLKTLERLKELGNTVIVVEHDMETIRASDYLIDIGLGAGIHGGNVIACGTPEEVAAHPDSLTGQYLSGREKIDVPKSRRQPNLNKQITVYGARANNLQNITVSFPLSTFIVVTGVSGSGKSSLTIHTLYKAAVKKLHHAKAICGEHDKITGLEYVDKVIQIDQSPIGRTPRSNPVTYNGAFTLIRDLFAALPESKMRGYKTGRFSFNVKGGRCEACEGDGVTKIEMHFLPDVYIVCDVCQSARYNRETLEIKYKNKSITDILNMTVDEACEFFDSIQMIKEKLVALSQVGLGYMRIGQSATTLSGGEAQRVKLSKELSRKSTGRTLYILDEPTTGLHSHDIKKLLDVLDALVDSGNTVVLIEHNLDVIKRADHIIDIGPMGGDKGGAVVVTGSPEEVVRCKESITGQYLGQYLEL